MMLRKTLQILIHICLLLIFFGCGTNARSDSDIKKEAKNFLLERVNDASFWNRIHALEFLCMSGCGTDVIRILNESFPGIENEPQKRIGYWRCYANASSNRADREKFLQNILNIYLNTDSPDKIHAAESLAKLNYSLRDYPSADITDDSTQNKILQAYIKWGKVIPSSASDKLDYDLLFSALNSNDKAERDILAYGISYMNTFDPAEWSRLSALALSEPLESPGVVHLLHGALVTCPDKNGNEEILHQIRQRLKSTVTVSDAKTNMYGVFTALGNCADKQDWEYVLNAFKSPNMFSDCLNQDEKNDVRSAMAFALLQINQGDKEQSFNVLDWLIVFVFLLFMLIVGYSASKKNKTAKDYVLGGGSMNSVMIGISLFATLLSTLSYLSYPGEMIKYGPVVFTGLLAFPVANWIVGRYLIPKFMSMHVTSAYEILEIKVGKGTRNLATIFFLSLRFLWMSTIVYATVDTALLPILGFGREWVPLISIILVLITVIYTTMGGLKAVVLTDVVQTFVMFAGVLLTIGIIFWKIGSLQALFEPFIFSHWEPIDFSINATKRMTVGNIFIMTLVWQVCTAGSDQMAIQRYLATKDAKSAKRSYAISLATSCSIQLLLALVGLMVMAYFTYYPEQMEEGKTIFNDADTLFPRFILVGLPPGITGLIAAAIMAAAMSSLSSGLNSSSTVIREDIINRIKKQKKDPQSDLKSIKRTSALLGFAIACSCFLVSYVTGNLFDVVVKVVNLVVAPLFVLFFMALFVPFATNKGTVTAGLLSLVIAILIAFFEIFNIKVLWIMPAALLVGVVAGVLISYVETHLLTKKRKL